MAAAFAHKKTGPCVSSPPSTGHRYFCCYCCSFFSSKAKLTTTEWFHRESTMNLVAVAHLTMALCYTVDRILLFYLFFLLVLPTALRLESGVGKGASGGCLLLAYPPLTTWLHIDHRICICIFKETQAPAIKVTFQFRTKAATKNGNEMVEYRVCGDRKTEWQSRGHFR